MNGSDEAAFDSLGKIKKEEFRVPEWARKSPFHSDKPGESSKQRQSTPPTTGHDDDERHGEGDASDSDDEQDIWEDAEDGLVGDNPAAKLFSNGELRALVAKANEFKAEGNRRFQSKPPDLDHAILLYQQALDCLPNLPKSIPPTLPKPAQSSTSSSGIEEITDEEASEIENASRKSPEEEEREEVENDVRECTKACWGNLAACYMAQNNDKEAVNACTKALEIDPTYVKALQRRTAINERIGSWNSLSSAQTDLEALINIAGSQSVQGLAYRRKISGLQSQIKVQQEKEKDEMMSKLKDLGNSLLGNFGLSTDNFKFDPQDGGGYSMRFEK